MRKVFFILTAALLNHFIAHAFLPQFNESFFEIGGGYRVDQLKFKTRGGLPSLGEEISDRTSSSSSFALPNDANRLVSRVDWHHLNIWQIEANAKCVTCENIYLRARGDYGWITEGKNRDKEFYDFSPVSVSPAVESLNIPSVEFYSMGSHAYGRVYDFDGAIGYQVKWYDDTFVFAPLIGFSLKEQHIRDHHFESSGDSTIDLSSSNSLRHNTYHTRWNSFFVGMDLSYLLTCHSVLFGSYEYHFANYNARGNWRRFASLVNGFHQHSNKAFAHLVNAGIRWNLGERWTVALKAEYHYFQARHGHDSALVSTNKLNGVKTNCHQIIGLRNVLWLSTSVSILAGAQF